MATGDAFDPTRAVLADRLDQFVPERAAPSDTGFIRRAIGDTAVSVGRGVIGAGEAVVGLADIASGGRAGKALEDLTGYEPKRTKAALGEFYSPEQRAANAEVGAAKGFVDTALAAVQNPSVIAQAAAESAPLMLGGGAIARGARAIAPGVAPVVAGAAGEGVITAGAQAEQIRQETPDRVLTPEQAMLAATSGAATGALTLGAGRVAQKLGISDVDIALAGGGMQGQNKGLIRRMVEGALSEGVLEEMPQSAQEQAIQNVALGKPWDEGVGSAAAMGALTGGVIGAGVNVAHGPRAPVVAAHEGGDAARDSEVAAWRQHAEAGPISAAIANEKLRELGARIRDGGDDAGALQIAARAGAPVGGPVLSTAGSAATPDAGGSDRGDAIESIVGGRPAAVETRGASPAAQATSTRSGAPADLGIGPVDGPIGGVAPAGQLQRASAGDLAQQIQELNERISRAANQAATSPQNDLEHPTAAQAAAGNYRVGRLRLHGLDLSIENPRDSLRVAKDGSWVSRSPAHYGYLRGTRAADGDHVDAFVGEHPESTRVFIVDQIDPKTGEHDEVKVMLAENSIEEAERTYRAAFPAGWGGLGAITETSTAGLKAWLRAGDTKRAFAPQSAQFQHPGGDAKRVKSGDFETAVPQRVRDMESGAQPLQQSRGQELQELRRPGDHHVSGVGDELRDLPFRPGAATAPELDAGPSRQRRAVQPGELPMGIAKGFNRESAMLSPDGAERRDGDALRGGTPTQGASDDVVESHRGARPAVGTGGLAGATSAVDGALDHARGGDSDAIGVGQATRDHLRGARGPSAQDAVDEGLVAGVIGEDQNGRLRRGDAVADRVGAQARDHAGRPRTSAAYDDPGARVAAGVHVAGGAASIGELEAVARSLAVRTEALARGFQRSRHRRNVDALATIEVQSRPDDDPLTHRLTAEPASLITGVLDGQRIDEGVGRALMPGERKLVAAALHDLLKGVKLPPSFLDDLSPLHAQDGVNAGDGTYRHEARAVGIHERVLSEVAVGDPYAARALRGIIAHEVMHHIDNGPRVYYSAEAADFAFSVNDEGKRVPTGAIVKQAWQAYLTGPTELQEFLKYPLAKINNPGTAAIDFDSWTNILKNEVFAQLGRLYYTNPELLQRAIPLGHALFQEIHHGATAATSIGGARGAVQHALRRRRSSNRLADRVDGGDRRDPREGAGGRQAGPRMGRDAGVRHRASPFDVEVPSLDVREPGDETVSPRNPTGKKSTENALDDPLQIGLAALKADPDAFAHNMALASSYPNFARGQVRAPDKRAERMVEHMVDNLLWLHDHVSPEIRERSQLWYDGANRIASRWAAEYGAERRTIAGVMAVLSPQKDWFMNVSLAKRVLDTVTQEQDTPWSSEMETTSARIFGKPEQAGLLAAIRGRRLAQLEALDEKAAWVRVFDEAHNARDYDVVSPEGEFADVARNADGRPSKVAWGSTPTIAKAISIFENQSIENIHRMLGNEHKVRSFYNNIVDPMSAGGHVTIDTHAVAAALLRPLSGNSREVLHNFGSGVVGEAGPRNSIVQGTSGLYGLYAEAYRRAAAERGALPRQMQSITWEAVRGLFQPTFKAQQRNVDAVDAIWDNFSKGKATLNEVRQQILELAGGVTPPEWVSDPRRDAASRRTADAGAVHRAGVAGRRPRSNDGGGRASAAPRVPQARARGVDKPTALDTIEGRDEPLWYSALATSLDKAPWAKGGTAGAGQLRAWLAGRLKDGTVKAEELKWSGLEEYLAAQPGKVSRDDVKAFLDQNGVRVEEVELGGRYVNPSTGETAPFKSGAGATKFGSYQLPGGENYRELLLTLPAEPKGEAWDVFDTKDQTSRQFADLAEAMAHARGHPSRAVSRVETGGGKFRSSHFDQPNILAHVRFNERTDAEGKRVLFLEEIQSDWAQTVRKQKDRNTADLETALRQVDKNLAPPAPFVGKTEAWVALALKRMIRYAADSGFDAVAWTTGEQQAARYDLSKHADTVKLDGREDGKYTLMVGQGIKTIFREENTTMARIEEIVGKDIAKKLREVERRHNGVAVLEGEDLRVGGEGMRSFYDKIVPNVANDLLKKMGGARVGAVKISTGVSDEWGVYDATGEDNEGLLSSHQTRAAAEEEADDHDGGVEVRQIPTMGAQPGFTIAPEMRARAQKPQALFVFEDGAPEADDAIRASVVTNVGHQFANRLRDLRGLGLQALGRRQIVEIYGNDIPALKHYQELAQRMDAAVNATAADADDIADRWGKLRDERALADLMHDATLAEMDPEKPYVDGDDHAKYLALRHRFEALSEEAQDVYRDARRTFNMHYFAVRNAIQKRIERAVPDHARRAALLERLENDLGRVKGFYAPLQRFGQYVIVVKDQAGDKAAVSFAETLSEAESTRVALLRRFPKNRGFEVGKILKRKEFNAARDGAGRGFMGDLFNVLDKSDASEELQHAVSQLWLTSLPDLSWRKHGINRKGTPGFSQDARRAFAANVTHGARYLAKLNYSDQLQDALSHAQEQVDARSADERYDSIAAQQVVDEMETRHQAYMNPNVSQLSNTLTSIGFVFHLGLSPASAAVNLAQTPLVAYPLMGARWGYGKAGVELMRASKQAMESRNDMRRALKGDELRAFDEAVRAGVIDVTLAHDLAGIAAGADTKAQWRMRPVMKAASFLFHHAERFNRQATLIAAYRLARDAGKDHAAAYTEAADVTFKSHFDYSAGNRPRFMQGNVARVVLLFKQFAQNMVYTLARSAIEAARGDRQALKVFSGLLVSHAMGAGILGLPAVSVLLAAASMIGGSDDEPLDAEVALRNLLADSLGSKPAEVLVHGLSRLTPWDVSGRVGLDRLIFPDVQEGLEGARLAESWSASALGPVAAIGINAVKGLHDIAGGHMSRGLEAMLPAALRGPVRALRYAQEGEVDRKGIPVLENTTLAEEIGQAVGFAPSRVREANDAKFAALSAEDRRKERRTELLTQFSRAWLDRDESGKIAAQEAILKYNRVNADAPILGHHLAASIRLRVRRAAESEHGYWVPRGRRAETEQIGQFGWGE